MTVERTRSRTGRGRRVASAMGLAAACAVLLSGCFLRSLVGYVDEFGGVSLSGNVEVFLCDFETTDPSFFGCTYIITDPEGGLFEITSTFDLVTDFGFLGVLADPLVVQVPTSATNVVATYNDAGSNQPLVVTETTSFPAALGVTVQAEPGTKFLILELPDAVVATLSGTGAEFDFDLDFDVPDPGAAVIKTMFTGRVDVDGVRYYVPIFPCVTDFAQVPAVQIPGGAEFQDLRPAFFGLIANAQALACDGVVYDFRAQQPPTTTTTTLPATTTTTAPATTTTTVAATTTSVASQAPTTTIRATTTTTRPRVLPATGSETSGWMVASMIAVAAGAVLVTVASRRRSAD